MKTFEGGVEMRHRGILTSLLEASSTVELYRFREELREKLIKGFSPEEAKEFINELLEFMHHYKKLRRDSEVLKKFAELLADYITVPDWHGDI